MMDTNSEVNGPYRATKMWNDVVYAFKSGMPVGRHRRNMKTFETCFVASDAVDWLHSYLKNNPNFGADVTRYQTIQLLQKFQKAQVFRDVRGNKHNKDQFEDNGRLYRFGSSTPAKSSKQRPALAPKTDNSSNFQTHEKKMDDTYKQQQCDPETQQGLSKCHLVARPLTREETQTTWKQMTLTRLQTLLGLRNIKEILEVNCINAKYMMHNATYVSRYGIVNNIPKEDQLPHWILSAMRCLAYWPERVEENLPRYSGFEKDVFNAVREHFQSFDEPLLTFDLCDMFLNAFARAERPDPRRSTPHANHYHRNGKDSFLSVENLMMSMASDHSPGTSMHGRFAMSNLDLSQIRKHDDSFSANSDKPPHDFIGSCNTSVTGASSFSELISRCRYTLARDTGRTVKLNTSSLSMQNYRDGGYDNFGYNHVSSSSNSSLRSSHKFFSSNNINDAGNFLDGNLHRRRASRDSVRSTSSEVFSSVKLSRRPRYDPGPVKTSSQYDLNRRDEDDAAALGRITEENHWELWRLKSAYARYKSQQPPVYQNPPPYNSTHQRGQPRSDVSNSSYLTSQDDVTEPPSVYRTAVEPDIPEASVSPQPDWVLNTPNSQKIDASGIFAESRKELINDVLQVCCMCLPPAKKRKLHLLLRLMNKMVNNDKLRLDDKIPIRTLVLRTFYKSIVLCSAEDVDDSVALRLTSTLVDNYEYIMCIPEQLVSDIHNKLAHMKRTKVKYTMEEPLMVSYCEQVSIKDYEQQKLDHSQVALAGLLDNIVECQTLSQKEKKKKLKQFQKQYPDIYKQRFPTVESECEVLPQKPKAKSVLFNRLKNIRF
ncbi:DEP domain-containing protein 1A-like [Tubulanus polymorphus]|uniref:DEP domain-containing protein 1A-like n=1 Tax=Tubulanus polymorphus TaxID=672921 RepID=UPI003DA4CD2C